MSSSAPPSGPPLGINRRRAERIPIGEGGPVSVVGGRMIDVSPYGMMIESVMALPTDSTHSFRVVVEGVKRDVRARVACCMPRPGTKRFGVGLEFVDVDADWREHVREVLTRFTASRKQAEKSEG